MFNHEYDYRPNWMTNSPLIITITIFDKTNAFLIFVKALLIPIVVESLSKVTNSSILEDHQIGRVSGRCYGYCDKLCC